MDQNSQNLQKALELPINSSKAAEELQKAFLSGRNPRTLRAYQADIRSFTEFCQASCESEAIVLLLRDGLGKANHLVLMYKANLVERGYQSATINRRLGALRSLVKFARTMGIVNWSLEVANLKSESYRDTQGPGVSPINQIFENLLKKQSLKAKRDYAILRLLFDLGLRRSEVASLNFENLHFEKRSISLVGKGSRELTRLSLPEPTLNALKCWVEVSPTDQSEGEPLFVNVDRAKKGSGRLSGTSIYRLVKRLGAEVGIDLWPHAIRHTAVTEAVKAAQENGIKLEEVMDYSRHKDVKTLMLYRDRERDVQGQLAQLVASSTSKK